MAQYYLDQPVGAYDGRDNRPIGDFQLCASISKAHRQTYISFWNVMTFNDRWLIIKPVVLTRMPSGNFRFDFTDNWDNEGRGVVEYLGQGRIRVEIRSTKPSDDPPNRIILGQYGTTILAQAACPHVRFLEGVVP